MQLNLPPPLLRVVAGCATAALVAGLTFTALARDYTSHPLRLGPLNTTIELPKSPHDDPEKAERTQDHGKDLTGTHH